MLRHVWAASAGFFGQLRVACPLLTDLSVDECDFARSESSQRSHACPQSGSPSPGNHTDARQCLCIVLLVVASASEHALLVNVPPPLGTEVSVICILSMLSLSVLIPCLTQLTCLPCRTQFAKWAQTLDYPVQGCWERLQLVRLCSCGWDPPVLGWRAREAAVEAYCAALQKTAKRRAQAAAAVAGTAASTSASAMQTSVPATAAQTGVPRMPQAGNAPAARSVKASTGQQRSEDGAATASFAMPQLLPGNPGFEGLSLCLFRRVSKGETVFRRG